MTLSEKILHPPPLDGSFIKPMEFPHPLFSTIPSVVGILALLFQLIALFGIPQTWSQAIKGINYMSAYGSSNAVVGILQKGAGVPNYIAFGLTGYCVSYNTNLALTGCQLGYGSNSALTNVLDHLGPDEVHAAMVNLFIATIVLTFIAVVCGLRSRLPVKFSLVYDVVTMISLIIAIICTIAFYTVSDSFFLIALGVFDGLGMTASLGFAQTITKIYACLLAAMAIGFVIKFLWYYRKGLKVYLTIMEILSGVWFLKKLFQCAVNKRKARSHETV